MKFTAWGHPNIRATHEKTFEFTKDEHLTPAGDCIIGVNADFSLDELQELFFYERFKIKVTAVKTITAEAEINHGFCSDHEIVIRRSNYLSDRTLGISCNKVAADFLPLIKYLKDPEQKITVEIFPL